MRAPRDRLRRRLPLPRKRGALLAPIHNTHSQDTWPEIGQTIASKTTRAGGAARVSDPAVPKRVAGDRALLDVYDQ